MTRSKMNILAVVSIVFGAFVLGRMCLKHEAQQIDFVVGLSATKVTAVQGSTWGVNVYTPLLNGSGNVELSAPALPVGATVRFSHEFNPPAAAQMHINTGTMPPGTYPIIVQGRSGSVVRTTELTLMVVPNDARSSACFDHCVFGSAVCNSSGLMQMCDRKLNGCTDWRPLRDPCSINQDQQHR